MNNKIQKGNVGQVKPDVKISMSCRKASIRHLRIFVFDEMVNKRKEKRRSPTETLGDDRPLCYNRINAFTLIELLVVVLIIGILAAVAVPQYQKAVWKSRFATIKGLTKSIAEAEETYRLANGEYTIDIDALSIDMPAATSISNSGNSYIYYYYPWGRCQITNFANYVECHLYKSGNTFISYQIYFQGDTICFAHNNLALAKEICKLDTKKNGTDVGNGITRYAY